MPIKPLRNENIDLAETKEKCTVKNQVPASISFVPSVAGEVIKDIIF